MENWDSLVTTVSLEFSLYFTVRKAISGGGGDATVIFNYVTKTEENFWD